jgi:hypothetical protein
MLQIKAMGMREKAAGVDFSYLACEQTVKFTCCCILVMLYLLLCIQIKAMGTRDKAAGVDFSGVLEQDVEDALKAAAQISMGTEISQEDLDNILALCDQVRFLAWLQTLLIWLQTT